MGNFCVPKKIDFTKINQTISIKSNYSNERYCSPRQSLAYRTLSSHNNLSQSNLKEAIMESRILSKEIQTRRFSMLSNESILVSRQGSLENDLNDNNSTDSAPETFTNTSQSSRNSSPAFGAANLANYNNQTIDPNTNVKDRFVKICFTKHHHSKSDIKDINDILEYASRTNLADIIDCKIHENSAISVAIIENNYMLLRCLMRFIPDFPEYVNFNNTNVPLLQAAAVSTSKDLKNENMLSLILERWIQDYSYLNVAIRNITAINSDRETILEFLLNQIFQNSSGNNHNLHFHNLDLLFKLFKLLQSKNVISATENRTISRLSSIVSDDHIFWTNERRKHLFNHIQRARTSENYCELLVTIFGRTN